MHVIPIVYRELRAAVRRKGTYRIRSWTTLAASIVSCGSLVFVSSGPLPARTANSLFTLLSGCAFVLCLLAGVFLTSDSLSLEKREGTLGLLFLSGLKGYEIVWGKFAALSLNAFFGLIALLPVMSMPLLIGGLTWADFSRTSLSLLNVLFVSLAVGIAVSAVARVPSRALGATFALVMLVAAGFPLLGALATTAHLSPLLSLPGWLSPAYPFAFATEPLYGLQPARFWGGLAVSNFPGWLALAAAAFILTWNQDERSDSVGGGGGLGWARLRTRRPKKRSKSDIIEVPMRWLVGDALWLRCLIWVVVSGWCLWVALKWGTKSQQAVAYFGAIVCALVLKMLIALQACRFFAESKRNGALELLLCTPLRNAEILSAQWRALRRLFLVPLLIFLAVSLGQIVFLMLSDSGHAASQVWLGEFRLRTGVPAILNLTSSLVADILAVGWLGMWLGLTMKRGNLAPGLTILFVLILPSIFSWLALAIDMFFISWGSTRLREDVRWILSRQFT